MRFSEHSCEEDWSEAREAIAYYKSVGPLLRRKKRTGMYEDGRCGIDLTHWPSIFLGVLVDPTDHRVTPSEPELGADFVAIVTVNRRNPTPSLATGDEFMRQPEFRRLVERLHADAGGWAFHDHVAEARRPNKWHPLHLRKPLTTVFAGAGTAEERYRCWLEAARHALGVLLAGGELRALRDRLAAEGPEPTNPDGASA